MNLNELVEKTPPQLRPLVVKYGPALLKMTAEEFCAWIEMLVLGRTFEAWKALVEKLDSPGVAVAWKDLAAQWDQANQRNAERLDLQKQAAMAVLKVLLSAALAMVGL